jgi:putative ABC transport system substrate-binding protein
MPVIGFLGISSPDASRVAAFRLGLGDTGWIDGRWAEDRPDRLAAIAADFLDRKVDVLMTQGAPSAVINAATTIPIVFISGGDPVQDRPVASLARPGGNLTGFTVFAAELMPKRLELLSELVPQASVIAMLVNPNSVLAERIIKDGQEVARAKGVQLHILKAGAEGEFETAFASLVRLNTGALVVGSDTLSNSRREELVALAARHAVPAIYELRESFEAGGLISYGASLAAVNRQVGAYVGRILAGAKPADLPVQQPTTFELVVNLKTAKALGLTVPPSILARADEVIE